MYVFTLKKYFALYYRPADQANTHSTKFRFINSFTFVYTRCVRTLLRIIIIICILLFIKEGMENLVIHNGIKTKTHSYRWEAIHKQGACLPYNCRWNFQLTLFTSEPGQADQFVFWFVLFWFDSMKIPLNAQYKEAWSTQIIWWSPKIMRSKL